MKRVSNTMINGLVYLTTFEWGLEFFQYAILGPEI
jgi:hypothetical protein